MAAKRTKADSAFTFDCIHAIYQVVSKFPGNDYSKTEFWTRASKHSSIPKRLKELEPEAIAGVWRFIKGKITSTQQFKSLFRDYERTNIKGNKYHEEIKANIIDIFFGGKDLDTPLKRRKELGSEEEEMPETSVKEESKAECLRDDCESDRQGEVHNEDSDDGEGLSALKETESGVKSGDLSSPKANSDIKEEKGTPVVTESTPPKSETAPSVKEGTPVVAEDSCIQDPKDLTELLMFDRKIGVDLNRLHKINGKVTTNSELALADSTSVHFFLDNNITADSLFVKVYLAVERGVVPEKMLSQSRSVKKMKPVERASEETLRVRALSRETGKTEDEVRRTLFAACGDAELAKKALAGESVRLWTPEEDLILTQSKVSKEYIELLKVNGKSCLLNRIQYLKSHSLT